MKLYLDLLYTSSIPDAFTLSSREMMSAAGDNLGNFAFRHALRNIVFDMDQYRPVLYGEVQQAGREGRVTNVLISCANWLGTSENDEAANSNRARAIEAVTVPVTCFGLGVQAKLSEGLPKLRANTARLAKVLSERAKALSVRDQITQDTLEGHGITNTVITGCPSNFINTDPQLGAKIGAEAQRASQSVTGWKDVRSLISEFSGGHPYSGKVLSDHLRLLRNSPAFYVLQSPMLLPLLLRETLEVPSTYINNDASAVNDDVSKVLRAKMLHFSSVDAWLDFSRTCNISFGMRIHGAMVPLQTGVPSILIAHDSRTAGLAEYMGMPNLLPDAFVKASATGPKALFEIVAAGITNYDIKRKALARIMRDYILTNGLIPHPLLLALTDGPSPHSVFAEDPPKKHL